MFLLLVPAPRFLLIFFCTLARLRAIVEGRGKSFAILMIVGRNKVIENL